MKGSYVLLIELPGDSEIQIGGLGKIKFRKGFYAYVGSALNGLEKRIERHFRAEKKFHWHIDYLLSSGEIKDVIYAETAEKKECCIAEILAKNLEVTRKFGSSDCNCIGHLFFSEDFSNLKGKVIDSFKDNGSGFGNEDVLKHSSLLDS
ncbi:MAG: hypothetical protein A7316_03185 [Candidatus Altiarchaeales archaeon WOR_SM1_86-2]|nr:MAG: hypothetical protein A7316_03185 [Candidatus Altiarchaeales archaeon WOR_SM1_86-2]ODS41491.1 MAG: hypothetical protein A7315_15080 [Candidatus Altiarchaeales archaeon WOR_SM1_79]